MHLKGLTNLKRLTLDSLQITDAGFAELPDHKVAPPPLLPPVQVRLLPHAVRAELSIGGVWIRQPKELNMKRLLLVMGMVGCGGPWPN